MAAVATEAIATAAMVQDVYWAAVAAAKERLDAYRF
jgi:predicted thioesterase